MVVLFCLRFFRDVEGAIPYRGRTTFLASRVLAVLANSREQKQALRLRRLSIRTLTTLFRYFCECFFEGVQGELFSLKKVPPAFSYKKSNSKHHITVGRYGPEVGSGEDFHLVNGGAELVHNGNDLFGIVRSTFPNVGD